MTEFSLGYIEKAKRDLAKLEEAFSPELLTVVRDLSASFKNSCTKMTVTKP